MKSAAAAKGGGFLGEGRTCNLSATLDRLDGDRDLLAMLISIFQEDSIELFDRLQAAAKNQNAAEAERNAHSLQGLSANFDGFSAVNAALVVEQAARQGDWQLIVDGLPNLERQLGRLRQALAEYQPGET